MNEISPNSGSALRQLVWIYTENPLTTLDSSTWIETTREMRLAGWKVGLIGEGRAGRRRHLGVGFLAIRRPRVFFVGQVVFHAKCLALVAKRIKRIDVVMGHAMSVPLLIVIRLLRSVVRSSSTPLIVLDTRTLPMESATELNLRSRLRAAYFTAATRIGGRFLDGTTAISPGMEIELKTPKKKRLGTWPSGVRPDSFSSCADARDWPNGDEPIELIYIGSLGEDRGLMSLCQAVSTVRGHGCAFRLTIVGAGPQLAALREIAQGSADGSIVVKSAVPHHEIPEILSRAHVGALPFPNLTKFRVSSPIKLFEYLAAGLVILATEIDCHTGPLKDHKGVVLVEPNGVSGLVAGLKELARKKAHLHEMGRESLLSAGRFSWASASRRLMADLETKLRTVS